MAYVVLELAEPTVINGIDIGNENSSFIEVRVGRKGDSDADFKELLLTSSFQTPNESRNSENPNRVRCFNQSALVESNASQKWQLVKLICSQLFNSRTQYGISFVKLYTPEEKKKEDAPVAAKVDEATKKKGGLLSLRDESPDSDTDTNAPSLFSRWQQARQNGSEGGTSPARATTAAAIRDARNSIGERKSPLVLTPIASTSAAKKKRTLPSTDSDTPVRDRNRSTGLLYDDDDEEEGNENLERMIEKDKQRAKEELKKDPKHKPEKVESTPAKKKIRLFDTEGDTPKNGQGSSKPKKANSFKPFKRLLEGVVLTISGIQNPERSTLREKAMAMGAKYRGDWDDSCTHLICAYRNTPKYNQVKGVGKIVRKDWVLECHQKRRNLPWRRYALESKEAAQSESEEEVWDERDKGEGMEVDKGESTKKPEDAEEEDLDDDDILMMYDQVEEPVVICDSDSETEEGIENGRKTTEEEEKDKPNDPLKVDEVENGVGKTGEFFRGKTFYLDEDNGAVRIIKMAAILSKHGG